MSLPLAVFLKRAEGRYPVYYGRGPARRRVEWLGDVRCPVWTELDARGGEVVARKACSLEKDRTDPGTLIGDFVFNEKRTRMGRITSGSDGWYFYQSLKEACQRKRVMADRLRHMDGREFAMPMDIFRGLQFFLTKTRLKQVLKLLSCKIEGEAAQIGAARADAYGLVVSADKRGRYAISPQCRAAAYSFPPSQGL